MALLRYEISHQQLKLTVYLKEQPMKIEETIDLNQYQQQSSTNSEENIER